MVPCHQCHRPEHTRNQASLMVANGTPHGEVAFPTFGQKCLLGGMLYIRYILMVNVLELWKTRTPDTFYTGRCSGCSKHCSQGHNPHSCPGSQRRFQHLGQPPRILELLRPPGKQLQGRDCLNPAALSSALKLFLLEARENSCSLQDSESQKVTRFTRRVPRVT